MESKIIRLVNCDLAILKAIAAGNDALADHLGVLVPEKWTVFGAPAFVYALAEIEKSPGSQAWWTWLPIHIASNTLVGSCGFKGPPDDAGMVEIGYEVAEIWRGQGLATEIARCLVGLAFADTEVKKVQAHTLAEVNPSTRVLTKNNFWRVGEVEDSDEGAIWKWELVSRHAQKKNLFGLSWEGFVTSYNLKNHDLQKGEDFVFVYSDGWTSRELMFVMRLTCDDRLLVNAWFKKGRAKEVHLESIIENETALIKNIREVIGDPNYVYHLKTEYDSGWTDLATAVLSFRFADYPHQMSYSIMPPGDRSTFSKMFQNDYEVKLMNLYLELEKVCNRLVREYESIQVSESNSMFQMRMH